MRKVLYILGQLNDRDVDWLTKVGEKRTVTAGTLLITQGYPIESLFIVLDGELAVEVGEGGGSMDLRHLGAGEMLGEVSFADSQPPSASVRAVQDSVVLAIPRAVIESRMRGDDAFAARFYRALSIFLAHRLRWLTARQSGAERSEIDDSRAGAELDDNVLDSVHLAGSRFSRILQRLEGG